ncbi:MAG: hypothetical protein ACI841_000900 [Planctomycetota bacterium]
MSGERRLSLPLIGVFLAILLAGLHCLQWGRWSALFGGIDFNDQPFEDFIGIYLPMGARVFDGSGPVPGFFYSPAFAMAMSPLAGMEQEAAAWVWLALQLVATMAVITLPVLIVRAGAKPRPPGYTGDEAVYLVVAIFSFPWLHSLHWGQVSIFLAALVLAGTLAHLRRRSILAGACFALAITIKFYPLLFLFPFVIKRERRVWVTAVAFSLITLIVVPMTVLGASVTGDFYRALIDGLRAVSQGSGLWHDAPNMQYMPAVVERWIGSHASAANWGRALPWIGIGAFTGVLACIWKRRAGGVTARDIALIAVSTPLVLSPSWPHYFVLVPFACLIAWQQRSIPVRALSISAGVLASFPVFLSFTSPEAYGRSGVLLVAKLLLLLALLSSLCARPRSD